MIFSSNWTWSKWTSLDSLGFEKSVVSFPALLVAKLYNLWALEQKDIRAVFMDDVLDVHVTSHMCTICTKVTPYTLGVFISDKSRKVMAAQGDSRAIDHAESNGVKIFQIKKYLGRAKIRQKNEFERHRFTIGRCDAERPKYAFFKFSRLSSVLG